MSLTLEPKQVRERKTPTPKIAKEPPGLALIYKTALLETLDSARWKYVKMDLPDDVELAAMQLENRLCNAFIDCGTCGAQGQGDGLHFAEIDNDGEGSLRIKERLGVWRYADMARDLIEFGVIKPAKAKGKSSGKKTAAETVDPRSLATVAKILNAEFPWLPQSIDLTNKTAARDFVARRLRELRVHLPNGETVCGTDEGLQVLKSVQISKGINAGEVVTKWTYDEVAAALAPVPTSPANGKPAAAVPAAALSPAARELPKPIEQNVMIEMRHLHRHPENRDPAEVDVKERAASLEADGQLEAVVLRWVGDRAKNKLSYQIISGETRYLAAKSLGWSQIRANVIECDDDEASFLLALYNGQRKDLNPIQKAIQIEHMCKRGKTREDAARAVGLESGSAASNLVRLLKLSKVWQERIASGELPETFARVLAGYAHVPGLMAQLEDDWEDNYMRGETFSSRDGLEESIQNMLDDHTRPVDDQTHQYHSHVITNNGSVPGGDYKCLLTADELAKHREQLGIVRLLKKVQTGPKGKIKWTSNEVEVATNVELYDKLQIPHIVAQHAAKGKSKAKAAGAAADAGEKKPAKSKEQLKHEAAVRVKQLERVIDDWVETVLRRETATAIRAFTPTVKVDQRLLNLVLSFMTRPGSLDSSGMVKVLGRALGKKLNAWEATYPAIATIASADKWQAAVVELCAYLIGGDKDRTAPAAIDDDVLLAIYGEWGGSLAVSWERLYRAKDPLIEEFFQLHRKDELAQLAKELVGKSFPENFGKGMIVVELCGQAKPPPLPKSLQPAKKRGGK